MRRRVIVFGPAYLDRVLQVAGPLGRLPCEPPLDQSVDGNPRFAGGTSFELVNPDGDVLAISLPEGWTGPSGRIEINLGRRLGDGSGNLCRIRGLASRDSLGGMGAGFAAALGGTLVHALGAEDDPTSRAVEARLGREGIDHRPVRIPGRPADWTLLVTSGEHGDKLAIGFRGCHAALSPADLDPWLAGPCDLRVVAALANDLAAHAPGAAGAGCRLFAPAMRNMLDRGCPVAGFARSVDVLCCNRLEWEGLEDREAVAWKVSILVVTDGPAGVRARFTAPDGESGEIRLPSLHQGRPPRDTNRAGEALAATLASTLLASGWVAGTGVVSRDVLRRALLRGSAAAALVIDRLEFGFPSDAEIDELLRAGAIS